MTLEYLVPILSAILLLGCASKISTTDFDGAQALTYIEQQVAFGPRVPGSVASAECRDYLKRHFVSKGLAVDSQSMTFDDPYSNNQIPLVNLIASFRGDKSDSKAILLMAHYDCRPRAEHAFDSSKSELAIDGANDAGSGVAILMELANMLAVSAPVANVDLVCVDGEDWGKPGDGDWYLLGSRHFASLGIRDKYHFGIVIDMVGDKSQQIYREFYSQTFVPTLNDYIWKTASQLNVTTFIDSVKYPIQDDHLSLNAGGVPSVVLIDFDYIYWHTEHDTPDKCSAESLANVGRVIAHILYNSSQWPKNL
ncbi:MAG: M28 family peptidase [candidate division Zixibacteria bacterium]|nr:M28 family peptidase [candidate division Zixibacteria bacterium]